MPSSGFGPFGRHHRQDGGIKPLTLREPWLCTIVLPCRPVDLSLHNVSIGIQSHFPTTGSPSRHPSRSKPLVPEASIAASQRKLRFIAPHYSAVTPFVSYGPLLRNRRPLVLLLRACARRRTKPAPRCLLNTGTDDAPLPAVHTAPYGPCLTRHLQRSTFEFKQNDLPRLSTSRLLQTCLKHQASMTL